MVDLGKVTWINHIKLRLHSPEKESYSYYIEVSFNEKEWDRVVDYTQYLCRSWQSLFFQSCPVRFIKLVGTNSTANDDFLVEKLQAFYTEKQPTLIGGLISPTYNVATTKNGAKVIEGFCTPLNTLDILLNGDTDRNGYTYHAIVSSGYTYATIGKRRSKIT